MAEEWIKFRKKLQRDGRVVSTARKCNASRVTVIGALVTLWCVADEHCDEHGALQGYTSDDLEREIGLPGFLSALPSDWFCVLEDGTPQLPNYQQHNGATAKKRASVLQRVHKHRKCNSQSVTKALPEKRREEKNNNTPIVPFSTPTVEQVAAYCAERNNGIPADQFVDYYTARGWKLTNNRKMVDWRAAVRTWERNGFHAKAEKVDFSKETLEREGKSWRP